MDNRITKKRLSAFLSYEWVLMIVICVAVIIAWEFVYTLGADKPTVGQSFKYYFDINAYGSTTSLDKLLSDSKTFSYDVLEFKGEQLSYEYNTIANRLTTQDGDIFITDCREDKEKQTEVRAKFVIDNYYGYSYEELLKDAQNYLLENFFKSGLTAQAFNAYDGGNIDDDKLEQVFRARMKKDNRFRKEEDIRYGIVLERDRIESLYKEVIDFAKILSYKNTHPELFMIYTKYDQSLQFPGDINPEYWEEQSKREAEAGLTNQIYALKLDVLASSFKGENVKNDPSNYVVYYGEYTAKDLCITVVNFKEHQPHLQFETISFINTIVRDCSNLLEA